MKWHVDDIPFLLTYLPHAVHDLMHHEDTALVNKTLKNLTAKENINTTHHYISTNAPRISIEKTLDPIVQRSVQNIGLLLHDYISQLPTLDASSAETEKLLKHWREIMLKHPQHLATAHLSHWHDEKTKSFWRDKLQAHRKALGISPETMLDAWDDWQRASGIGHATGNPLQMQAMQHKQWHDLVIRSRLHHETVTRNMEW
jgi:hypothetical protein